MPGQRIFVSSFVEVSKAFCNTILPVILLGILVEAAQNRNVTLQVPIETTNHGDPSLLCTPTQWTDVVLFLCGNYIAHALTVVSKPGEPGWDLLLRTVVALFFPNYGVRDGLDRIFKHAIFVKDPLQRAARASSLCMVVRSALWKPRVGGVVRGIHFSEDELLNFRAFECTDQKKLEQVLSHGSEELKRESFVSSTTLGRDEYGQNPLKLPPSLCKGARSTKPLELVRSSFYSSDVPDDVCFDKIPTKWEVNSLVKLSNEYQLVLGPEDALLVPTTSAEDPVRVNETKYPATLSAHVTSAKAVIAIFQTLYSCATLYLARGDQIIQYGYAAFGLTVAPYSIMSIVNLVGNLCTPDFAALQLVSSPALDEALDRGHRIGAVVGRLAEAPVDSSSWNGTIVAIDSEKEVYLMDLKPEDSLLANAKPFTALVHIGSDSKPSRQSLTEARLDKVRRSSPMGKRYMRAFLIMVVTLAPFCINGAISKFDAGRSNRAQRLWTMSWLVIGAIGRWGATYGPIREALYVETEPGDGFWTITIVLLCMLVYGMPVIGGMSAVIQMLLQYGSCTRFD